MFCAVRSPDDNSPIGLEAIETGEEMSEVNPAASGGEPATAESTPGESETDFDGEKDGHSERATSRGSGLAQRPAEARRE